MSHSNHGTVGSKPYCVTTIQTPCDDLGDALNEVGGYRVVGTHGLCYDTIITMVSPSVCPLVQVIEMRLVSRVIQEVTCEYQHGGPDRRVVGSGQGARL